MRFSLRSGIAAVVVSFLVSAHTAEAEICVHNDTTRKVRIIQATDFISKADGSMDIINEVDKRILMPQEEYCVPAGNEFYRASTRFAFELIASLNDIPRRFNSARFNVLENPLPPIDSTLTIGGTLAAPKAKVLANGKPFHYGRLKKLVFRNG